MDLSPEPKKKMKKDKLSKSVASKKLSKDEILNRMSSGKKRPKSETKIKKGQKAPTKEDLVAKKLSFQDSDDEDLRQSPVKSKLSGGSVSKTSSTRKGKKAQSSTSKWEVSEGKPSVEKPMKAQKEKDTDLTKESIDIEVFEADAEIDFPVLKRKSLGLGELKAAQKSPEKKAKVPVKITENGKDEKKSEEVKGTTMSEDSVRDSVEKNEGEEKGKRKKNKKRGKKRRRSDSEMEEPNAKKEKPSAGESFAVRCGNLPAGANKSSLKMFIGEADIFPTNIILKRHKKSRRNEKKLFLKYATILCSSAEEVEKLCNLNGIMMPSPLGSRGKNLLIHKIVADGSSQDPITKCKLFIGNLHLKVKEEDLKEFFETAKCHPTNIIIPKKGGEQESRGYAFVYMQSGSDVERALKLKQPTLRDRILSIARSRNRHPNAQEP